MNTIILTIFNDATAAFLGAFFAFIFGVVSFLLIKRWDRFNLHRNAVVKLTYLLNEYIDRIGINNNLLQGSQGYLRQGMLTYNRLLSLKVYENLDLEFENLTLINRYFEFKLGVSRINEDLQSLNYTLTRFEEVLTHGQPLPKENFERTSNRMLGSVGILSNFDKETKELLSFSRIHLKKIENWNLFSFPLKRRWEINITEQEIDKELKLLDQEINENKNKSKIHYSGNHERIF